MGFRTSWPWQWTIFKTSVNIRPTTKRHIPEELNLQQHLCENLKSRKRLLSSDVWHSMTLMGKGRKTLQTKFSQPFNNPWRNLRGARLQEILLHSIATTNWNLKVTLWLNAHFVCHNIVLNVVQMFWGMNNVVKGKCSGPLWNTWKG
jgi:hypothetical protein